MTIHKEGKPTITLSVIIIIAFILVVNIIQPINTIIHYTLYTIFFILIAFILWFFRSPKRKVIINPDCVLSPADGKVLAIEKKIETEYFKKEMIQVSVFMSPLNVHLNRYPVSGEVVYSKYHPGKYLVAWHPKASEKNERTSIVLSTEKKVSLLVRQIAGTVARRIVYYSKPGEIVKQGDEMGFIKFGSRADIFIPLETEILVKIGEKVKAGKSIIAKI